MQGDSFKIAVLCDDSLFLKELKNQLKDQFPTLVCELSLQETERSIVQNLKKEQFDLIVAVEKNLDSSLVDFEKDIQRISGSTAILFLCGKEKIKDGQTLLWPMVEWGTFIERIFEMIPEEMKQKAGLKRKDTILYQELQKYVKQFIVDSSPVHLHAIALVPQANEEIESSRTSEMNSRNVVTTVESPNSSLPKNWMVFEMIVSVFLIGSSVLSYIYIENRWVFFVLFGTANLSLVSLALSRFFNPIIKKGQ